MTFKKAGLSPLIGYIMGGIVVDPIFKLVNPTSEILAFLSELGIILISFDIGLYLKLDFFKREGVSAAIITIMQTMAVTLLSYLFGTIASLSVSEILLFVFMAANTSTAVTFMIIRERTFIKAETRVLVLGIAAFEDIFALIGLTAFPILLSASSASVKDLLWIVEA